MNIIEFVNAVRKMRTAQKMYFRIRQRVYLELSKQLEKEVDKALADGVILQVPTTTVAPEEEHQLRLHLDDGEPDAALIRPRQIQPAAPWPEPSPASRAISELDVELGFPPGSVERFIKANPPHRAETVEK